MDRPSDEQKIVVKEMLRGRGPLILMQEASVEKREILGVKELKVFEGHMDWNLNLSMTLSALPVQWIHRFVRQHSNTMSDGWFIRRRVLLIPPYYSVPQSRDFPHASRSPSCMVLRTQA